MLNRQARVHRKCGRAEPLIVEGMVHGSTVHGMGAALLEELRYDASQLLTATLMDYLKPTAPVEDAGSLLYEGLRPARF